MNHRTHKKATGSNRSTKGRSKAAKEKRSYLSSGDAAINSSDARRSAAATWVDGLRFEAAGDNDSDRETVAPAAGPSSCSLSVLSWNILADSYCRPSSQTHLPPDYKKKVFYGKHRRESVVRILKRFALEERVDVICLQEVDLDEIKVALDECGYDSIETSRIRGSGGGAGGRVDSCSIFARKETWQVADYEVIRLDDLSYLSSASPSQPCPSSADDEPTVEDVAHKESAASAPVYSNFQGLQQSFQRRNRAVLARVRHRETGQTVVVGNCHLYWHPAYEYLKLCQAHYTLLRARLFCGADEPFVFCGDLNSEPFGATHTYLTKGSINAKRYAPWYRVHDREEELVTPNASFDDRSDVTEQLRNLALKNESTPTGSPRYLLDATLNKLCRWMRILGLDAALETDEEEKLRTGEGKIILFDRCRTEKRTLVTTSTRLQGRSECPPGAYVISPTFLDKLEVVLVHTLLTHGVVLVPGAFLSRCVICNGAIELVHASNEKLRILQGYEAPVGMLDDDMEVYQCDGCGQGYWWCDRPTSSASRVKSTATRLFQLCLRAGIQTEGPLSMMEHVNLEEERRQGWDYSQPGSELLNQKLDVIEWLRSDTLECPYRLDSVYARRSSEGRVVGELLPFTNVTHDFVNTLDYIFVSGLTVKERLAIPTSLSALNTKGIENGHLLPSDIWPSDHLPVGSRLSVPCQRVDSWSADTSSQLLSQEVERVTSGVRSNPMPSCSFIGDGEPPPAMTPLSSQVHGAPGHGSRCACGCVPNVPSLFEMAEFRRKARSAKSNVAS